MAAVQVRVTIGIEARYCKGEERIAMIDFLTEPNRYSEYLSKIVRLHSDGTTETKRTHLWFATVFWVAVYGWIHSFLNTLDV